MPAATALWAPTCPAPLTGPHHPQGLQPPHPDASACVPPQHQALRHALPWGARLSHGQTPVPRTGGLLRGWEHSPSPRLLRDLPRQKGLAPSCAAAGLGPRQLLGAVTPVQAPQHLVLSTGCPWGRLFLPPPQRCLLQLLGEQDRSRGQDEPGPCRAATGARLCPHCPVSGCLPQGQWLHLGMAPAPTSLQAGCRGLHRGHLCQTDTSARPRPHQALAEPPAPSSALCQARAWCHRPQPERGRPAVGAEAQGS